MRFLPFVTVAAVVLSFAAPGPAEPQTPAQAAVRSAREAQRRFEAERIRSSPENPAPGGASCDEIIGRICHDDQEGGDWYPGPESPRIVDARSALIAELERSAESAPDDPWILGQRVVYLGEAGQWERADSVARDACVRIGGRDDAQPKAWCGALDGLALHAMGRFVDAERAFRAAIARMDSTRARVWLDPEPWLDAVGRSWWKRTPVLERPARATLVWFLADPLLLVPGNEALTESWARRTLAEARASAANGYGLSWGSDLEELMLRFGAEVGWERAAARPLEAGPLVGIGHHHPEGRPLFPGGRVLLDPAATGARDWIPDLRTMRSGYAPPYASVVLPSAGQLAIFPRGDGFVLVGAHALPEDTTYHAKHDHPLRKEVRSRWRGQPTEAGLFLIPVDPDSMGHRAALASRTVATEEASLLLEAPAGTWVASLEILAPEQRRAGRTRMGVTYAASPSDVPTLSDLLLVDSALADGSVLADAAARARPRDWLVSGERLAIAWELFGLGYGTGSLSYRLSVERADVGFLRRAGGRLGLLRPPFSQSLEWQEPSPDRPGVVLRSVEIELPRADPGLYRVRLEVGISGRTPLIRERMVEIRP